MIERWIVDDITNAKISNHYDDFGTRNILSESEVSAYSLNCISQENMRLLLTHSRGSRILNQNRQT